MLELECLLYTEFLKLYLIISIINHYLLILSFEDGKRRFQEAIARKKIRLDR